MFKHHFKYFLIVILILASFLEIDAQLNLFRNYNLKDGLDQNYIYAIEQDENDYLWLGTEEGIIKFERYTLRVYIQLDIKTAMGQELRK